MTPINMQIECVMQYILQGNLVYSDESFYLGISIDNIWIRKQFLFSYDNYIKQGTVSIVFNSNDILMIYIYTSMCWMAGIIEYIVSIQVTKELHNWI